MKKVKYMLTALMMASSANTVQAVKSTDLLPENMNSKEFKGVEVRKGTVAATIQNVELLDALMQSDEDHESLAGVIKDQRPLCKPLWALDLTERQPIDLWINDAQRPGRTLVAVFIMQEVPDLVTDAVRESLESMLPEAHPVLAQEISKLLNQ